MRALMRRYFSITSLLVAPALLAVGCDSNDEGPTDAERFVGTWTAIAITDSNGDQSAAFAELVTSMTVVFQAGDEDPAFSLTVDYTEASEREDLLLPGTYAVDDGPRSLTLTIVSGASLPFTYAFENDSRARLTTSAALVNPVFEPTTPYEGTVMVTIQKQ